MQLESTDAPGFALKESLDQYIDGVRHLPPAPTLIVKLLELFKQPDRDIDEIVSLISLDPALTAEVLRLCNSAFLGSGRPARDMFEAVSRLGFYEVYRVVVAMFGSQALAMRGSDGGLDFERLWHHSLATAVAGGVLADRVGDFQGSAFTAGLLHDIGKVILASVEGDRFAQLARSAGPDRFSLQEEKRLFVFDHCELGARLLARWNMPTDIYAAVLHHHNLAGAEPFDELAAVVHLANSLAHAFERGDRIPNPGTVQNAEPLAILKMDSEELPALMEKLSVGMKQAESLMSL